MTTKKSTQFRDLKLLPLNQGLNQKFVKTIYNILFENNVYELFLLQPLSNVVEISSLTNIS